GYAETGATIEDLKLMRAHSPPHVQVKAAGGVRTFETLMAVRAVGVTRVGATATKAILDDARAKLGSGGGLAWGTGFQPVPARHRLEACATRQQAGRPHDPHPRPKAAPRRPLGAPGGLPAAHGLLRALGEDHPAGDGRDRPVLQRHRPGPEDRQE